MFKLGLFCLGIFLSVFLGLLSGNVLQFGTVLSGHEIFHPAELETGTSSWKLGLRVETSYRYFELETD